MKESSHAIPEVLYICDVDISKDSAPSIHVREIVKNLGVIGCKIQLITPRFNKKRNSNGIVQLAAHKKHFASTYNVSVAYELFKRAIKGRNIVIYTRQSSMLLAPALISRIFSIPYITEVNGTAVEEHSIDRVSQILLKIQRYIEQYCYYSARKIICASTNLKDYLEKQYSVPASKIVYIENGVDTRKFRPIRSKRDPNSDSITIGYTGGLQQWQGVDYIIRSIDILNKRNIDCKLEIVGDGPEKKSLMKLVHELGLEKNVTFVGSIPHHRIARRISNYDICICYLVKEKKKKYGTPFKIYEYLACGKPVIMSRLRKFQNLYGAVIIYAPPESSKGLADTIIALKMNPELRYKLGQNGRNYILTGHTWKDSAIRTMETIQDVFY